MKPEKTFFCIGMTIVLIWGAASLLYELCCIIKTTIDDDFVLPESFVLFKAWATIITAIVAVSCFAISDLLEKRRLEELEEKQ